MNKRRFDIVEIEGEEIYHVSWDTDDEDVEVLLFDNYEEALKQYNHLKKLNKNGVELGLQLLPLPRLPRKEEE